MESKILYNTIGLGYNTTRKPDGYITHRLKELLNPREDRLYLDIGCGTGNYTNALAGNQYRFYGVDPSEHMLEHARTNNNQIKWLAGTAENIPVSDNMFAGAIATLTIHHWGDLQIAFKELARVLEPGGHIVLFTSDPKQMQGYWLHHYFPGILKQATEKMPSLEKVAQSADTAGLKVVRTEPYFVKDDLQDHFLYVGKNNPVLYFDAYIRRGISTFASADNETEVNNGLKNLKDDLASNQFERIQRNYQNNLGDYLFVVLKKGQASDRISDRLEI